MRVDHIFPWFTHFLVTHLSPIDVEMETQYANIVLKSCALTMDSQQGTMDSNLLQYILDEVFKKGISCRVNFVIRSLMAKKLNDHKGGIFFLFLLFLIDFHIFQLSTLRTNLTSHALPHVHEIHVFSTKMSHGLWHNSQGHYFFYGKH